MNLPRAIDQIYLRGESFGWDTVVAEAATDPIESSRILGSELVRTFNRATVGPRAWILSFEITWPDATQTFVNLVNDGKNRPSAIYEPLEQFTCWLGVDAFWAFYIICGTQFDRPIYRAKIFTGWQNGLFEAFGDMMLLQDIQGYFR